MCPIARYWQFLTMLDPLCYQNNQEWGAIRRRLGVCVCVCVDIRVFHKNQGVDNKRASHGTRDEVGILLEIKNGSHRNTKVRDGSCKTTEKVISMKIVYQPAAAAINGINVPQKWVEQMSKH